MHGDDYGCMQTPPRAWLVESLFQFQMSTESEKTVLVHLGERARPVKFFGGTKALLSAIRSGFRDVLIGNEEMILQVCLFVCLLLCLPQLHKYATIIVNVECYTCMPLTAER